MATKRTVIIIGGPTASGKTAVALTVARHFRTEIISADSRQCYKELNIGVARPSADELKSVPHHFIADHSIHEKVTAISFEKYALERCNRIFEHRDVVVMVGGTGLYIKAFCEGLDEIPEVPATIHHEIISAYQVKGIEWLQEEIKNLDPGFFETGEIYNPQRLMRALEVYKSTGRSVNDFRTGKKAERPFNILKIALELPRPGLYERINKRVDKMIVEGLEEEVRSLIPYQHLNALQTVGYKELFACFNGEMTLPEAFSAIKQNTRHYAKRQMTWFRKDLDFNWFDPQNEWGIIQFVTNKISV